MAYYQEFNKKKMTREDHLRQESTWDEEGSHYPTKFGGKKPAGGGHFDGPKGGRPDFKKGPRDGGFRSEGRPDFKKGSRDGGFRPEGRPDFKKGPRNDDFRPEFKKGPRDGGFRPEGRPDFKKGPRNDDFRPDFRKGPRDGGFRPEGRPDFKKGPRNDDFRPDFRKGPRDDGFRPEGRPDFKKGPRDGGFRPEGRPDWKKPAPRPEGFRPDGPRPEWKKPAPKPEFREHPAEDRPLPPKPAFRDDNEMTPPENLLSGRNPIREAIKADRDIEKLLVAKGDLSATAREIVAMAREKHIPVQMVERSRLDEITKNHQGMLAFASAYKYYDVEDMLADAEAKNEPPFLVVLDGVTDPQNLGAIIRTASCVGAHGVIVPERRAVGLTPSAVKASAGAIELVKVARVTNLTRTLEMLQQRGVWLFAADMVGEDYRKVDFSGPCAIIIGAEGDGVSRLVLETCDHTVSLPMKEGVGSLNASVAAGVLLYAAFACR